MKNLKEKYLSVRKQTMKIVEPLEVEDYCIQSIPQVSPPKWHLAHTTWFFERLILQKFIQNYKPAHPEFYHLFNSYYKSLGSHWIRVERGHLSRPTVKEIVKYRKEIDEKMTEILDQDVSSELEEIFVLGLNHEQQHQELLFMDIKNIYFLQYGDLVYQPKSNPQSFEDNVNSKILSFDGGFFEVGANSSQAHFSYDNEGPRHKAWLPPFKLSSRLTTNEEYLEFINAGGYQNSEFWLSDGWNWVNENKILAPLYWIQKDGSWFEFGLHGLSRLNKNLPVSHVSYYEAQAFARFKGLRLPTEFEWEFAAQKFPSINQKSFFQNDKLEPFVGVSDFDDLHGSLWQWTQSGYYPYPGHEWKKGPLGEYNSKFMVNQQVLRGGCFATEKDHYRSTYRNFFYPNERWAFTGLRLAGNS